jgi:MFS family permease
MALVIAYSSKQERDQNIGFMEAFTGLGFLTGPLIGSVMFTIGGYMMPFLTCGCIYVLCFPFIVYNLQKGKRDRDCTSSEKE